MVFKLEQKKGDPKHLDGRVVVYALIDIDQSELIAMKHPISSMVHNGLLVAQGNFKEQTSLKDFLKSEMGISLEDEGLNEGLAQLLEKMDGLESALDPQKLKDRLENMGEIEELIPTPAKIVPFHSQEEILDFEGDVFYVGAFRNIGNAVLSVNALPILYQAWYREQELQTIRNEIESLISQIETGGTTTESSANRPSEVVNGAEIEEKLLKEYIPNMLYSRKEPHDFEEVVGHFRSFMGNYQFREDVEGIIQTIGQPRELTAKDYRTLELYAKKISAILSEKFDTAEEIRKEIEKISSQPD